MEGVDEIFRNMQITCTDEVQCEYPYRKGFTGAGSCMDCKAYKKAKQQLRQSIKRETIEKLEKIIDEMYKEEPNSGMRYILTELKQKLKG